MSATTKFSGMRLPLVLALACLASFQSGCVSVGLSKFGKNKIPVATNKNPVVNLLAIWQPGDGPGIDGKTTRGFVGQIYFFTTGSAVASKVDGEVWVYLFDDQGTEEEQIKPLHQFQYRAEDWVKLGQPGKLGQVYSIFVPYTRPGFQKVQCSLRMKYIPAKGMPVYSEMAYVGLPGRKAKTQEAASRTRRADSAANGAEDDADVGGDVEALEETDTRPFGLSNSNRAAMGGLPPSVVQKLQSIDLSGLQNRPKRPVGSPLDDRERERIVREMRARGESFAVADEFDVEPESELPPTRKSRARRVVQANYEVEGDDVDDWEEAAPPVRRPAVEKRHANSGRRRLSAAVLADASELNEEEVDFGFDDR